jgi:hypothetical protein
VVSPFGELILALTQLLLESEAAFKETAAQAAARLQSEAQQNASDQASQFLASAASALQDSSRTGQLPNLPTPQAQNIQSYGKNGQPDIVTAVSGPSKIIAMLAAQANARVQALAQANQVES